MIVGRDAERAAIGSFLDRSAEGPVALVIDGPAGIGKSTLWLDAVAAARERGLMVLASRPAETERDLANVVLGDLFDSVEQDRLATLPAPRRRAFEAALLRRDEPSLHVDPRALGVAILTLLPVLARDRPLVLAIDDDQWMDPSSGATLAFALRRLQGDRVSVLLSRRRPDPPPIALEDALDVSSRSRLTVGPLSVGALHAVLRERLGTALPRPMQLRLHEASGGNPFYALELARASRPDPAVGASGAVALPPSVERLVEARTGSLDDETRTLLLLIAAHGRFPVAALTALSVAPGAVDCARAAGVIETQDGVIRFTHPVLASAMYGGATPDDRRAAHRRLATVAEDPVHRARHLALGAEAPDDALAATIESAALLAHSRGVPGATAELSEHALRLTPPGNTADRHRRAMAAARSNGAAGDTTRARAIAAEVLAGAPAGRPRAEALVLGSELEGATRAVAMLEDALSAAAGDPHLQAEIHARLAENDSFGSAQRGAAARHAQASLRLAEQLDDDGLRANALSVLAVDGFSRGHEDALALAERAYELAADLDDPKLLTKAGQAVGHVLTWTGLTDRAREWLERCLARWSDRDEQARLDFLWYLALVELWAGRWDVARAYADEASEIATAYAEPYGDFPSAIIALHEGDTARARSLAERALSIADHEELMDSYFGVLGACELWSGHAEAALVHFERAERAGNALGTLEPSLQEWRADMIEALLQVGRIDEAERLATDWDTAAQRLGRERVLAQALRCRGLIAAARGNVEAASALLEEAVTRHRAVGDPFGAARAALALGTNRRRAQQKRTARESLQAALAGFEALGVTGWAATARSELGRIGGRSRISGLSPSELSVATLVAEGRTNREIAASLFLAERTIASHLTSIYSKLGVRSRTELARQFVPPSQESAESAGKVQTS